MPQKKRQVQFTKLNPHLDKLGKAVGPTDQADFFVD